MRRIALALFSIVLTACSGDSPSSPTPALPAGPVPSPPAGPGGGVTTSGAVVLNDDFDGQIAGTWKLHRRGTRLTVETIPLRALTGPEARGARDAAGRCERFFNS